MTSSRSRIPSARWGRRLSALVVGAAVSIVAACTLLNPLDEYGPGNPKDDASAPSSETSVDAGPSCVHERWPDRPSKDDTPGEIPELVFALQSLELGAPPDAGVQVTTGFDLDNTCTCPAQPTCIPPDGSSPCDDDGGVDQKGSDLIVSLAGISRFVFNGTERLSKGGKGLLLRVAKWNGSANDAQVELALFPSLGTEDDDAGNTKMPAHDGNDRWTVDKAALLFGQAYAPNYVDQNAYVTNGWLVSRASFPLYLGDLVMSLVDSVIVMRIAKDGDKYTLENGRLVGRLPAAQLLTGLSAFEDPFLGGGICGDSGTYLDVKRRFCGAVDLMADPARDNTSARCDAFGMTILFTAEQAQFGAVLDREPLPKFCGPDYSDDCSR